MKQNCERPKKTWNKKFRISDLNSLKPYKFEPKTNIRHVISSGSDYEEGAERKVKQISNSEWCECIAKAVVGRCSSK